MTCCSRCETTATYYLDASCFLRHLVGDGPALDPWGRWDIGISSEIAQIEVHRTLDRVHRERRLTDEALDAARFRFLELEATVDWLPVSAEVRRAASGPLPGVVKTLDAVHLGAALVTREGGLADLVFATHDRRLGATAALLGFRVAVG